MTWNRVFSFTLCILVATYTFAQGYVLDEVYKESSSKDSDYNPFYAFIGIIIIVVAWYILKAVFSSFSSGGTSDKPNKVSQVVKEPTQQEIVADAMKELSRRIE